ncbi:MAG: ATP-binding protein [Chloroflexota bacterium]
MRSLIARPRSRRFAPRSFVADSILLSMALVLATAVALGVTSAWLVSRQVEEAADHRLEVGATLFQALLADTAGDLDAVARWLASDGELAGALGDGDVASVESRLGFALRLTAVDDALAATPDGRVVGHVQLGSGRRRETAADLPGFPAAIAGRSAGGIRLGSGAAILQEVYEPIRRTGGDLPAGMLRLASVISERNADQFRQRTGLDLSLFFADERVLTTIRDAGGQPLRGAGPPVTVSAAVLRDGHPAHATRDLPAGRVRAYYVPLDGSDGSRVAMLGISIPLRTVREEVAAAVLPGAVVTAFIALAGAGLAYLVTRRIHQPALALAVAARKLGMGDLDTPVPVVADPGLEPLAAQLEHARLGLRQRAQNAAAEDTRQRAILDAQRDPVLATTVDGRVSGFNPAVAALFGHPGRVYGRPIADILPLVNSRPEQPEAHEPSELCRWHGQLVDASGRSLDVEVTRTTLVEGQLPAAHVYVVHDVSHLAELNRLREQLLYNVAHELRAPLGVLENALDIMAADYGELSAAEFDRLAGGAHKAAGRLRALMEDLLSAGNIQSGRFQVHPRPTSLAVIVDDAFEVVGPALALRGQRLETPSPGKSPVVLADRRYMRQVLSNLLANASEYGPEDQAIRLETDRVDGHVRVRVVDQGPGIPPEHQRGLFERYYRVRPRHEEPGIGLGLAIAKGIVEAHGGSIGIESVLGQGTSVWITLPAAESPESV